MLWRRAIVQLVPHGEDLRRSLREARLPAGDLIVERVLLAQLLAKPGWITVNVNAFVEN